MECIQCKRPFSDEDRIAAISGSIMGDEYAEVYCLCPVCMVYTIASFRDNFTGVETENFLGPLEKQKGDAAVELIGQCSRPWDKKCRCEAHRKYFNNRLD